MTVKPKITELLKRLNDGVLEKEDVIGLAPYKLDGFLKLV
jgi:hypothetical protein